jgi:hypothetical protein
MSCVSISSCPGHCAGSAVVCGGACGIAPDLGSGNNLGNWRWNNLRDNISSLFGRRLCGRPTGRSTACSRATTARTAQIWRSCKNPPPVDTGRGRRRPSGWAPRASQHGGAPCPVAPLCLTVPWCASQPESPPLRVVECRSNTRYSPSITTAGGRSFPSRRKRRPSHQIRAATPRPATSPRARTNAPKARPSMTRSTAKTPARMRSG